MNAHKLVAFLSLSDVFLACFGLLVAVQHLDRPIEISYPAAVSILLFALLAVARVVPMVVDDAGAAHFKFLLTGVVVVTFHAALSATISRRGQVHTLLRVLVISAVLISGVNILQAYELVTLPAPFARFSFTRSIGPITLPVARRSVAVFSSFGLFGIWTTAAAAFALVSVYDEAILSRLVAIPSLGVLLYANVVVLQSRSVWLGVVAMLGTVGLLLALRHRAWFKRLVVPSSVVAVLVSPLIVPRIVEAVIGIRAATVENRIEQYVVALDVFRTAPLTGVAFGTVREVTGYALHNLYLQILAYSGLVGVAAFLLVLGVLGKRSIYHLTSRSIDSVAAGLLGAVVAALAISLFVPTVTSYVFWTLVSLAVLYTGLPTLDSTERPSPGVTSITPSDGSRSASCDERGHSAR